MESISLLCDCSRTHLSATREGSHGFLPCFGPWIVFSSSELSETIPVEKILVENHFPVMVDAATVADGDCGIGSKECVGVLIPVKSPPFAVNSLAVVHCSYNKRDVRWKRLKRHKKLRFRNNTAFEIKKKKRQVCSGWIVCFIGPGPHPSCLLHFFVTVDLFFLGLVIL
jgi:hypothetical protein